MREPAEKDATDTLGGRLHKWAEGHHERNRAIALAELAKEPEAPEALAYLWEWWRALDASRGEGMNGPRGITYTDIDAWARLTEREPTREEVEALMTLDAVVRHPGKRGELG